MVVGVAFGGDGRRLTVREGRTRRCGARGGNGEPGGGPRAALHGGSMVAEQGSAVGVTGRRKKGCSRGGWAPFIAGIGGGRKRRGGESGGGEMAAGESTVLVVPRFGQAARSLCERGAAVRPVGSGRFNRVGWYCRHGLGPIRCNFFPNYSNFAPILKYKTKTSLCP
jgi:hypothetical protein